MRRIPESNTPINILLLFQGKRSKEILPDIRREIERNDIVKTTVYEVGDGTSTLEKFVLEEVEKKMDICDGAIAIITQDTRAASIAGNLWLEVGLWCGKKSTDSIILFQESAPKNQKYWKVKTPSNFAGNIVPRFSSTDELLKELPGFLTGISQKKSISKYYSISGRESEIKIRETMILNRGHGFGDPSDIFICLKENSKCDFRENSMHLLAELLRLGKFNRENVFIESVLVNISSLCSTISMNKMKFNNAFKKGEDTISYNEQCKSNSEKLSKTINYLKIFSNKMLIRRDSYKTLDLDDSISHKDTKEKLYEDPWECIENFLKYRLEKAGDDDRFNYQIPLTSNSSRAHVYERLHNFVEWISNSHDTYIDYSDLNYIENGTINKPFELLKRYGDFSLELSKMLSLLSDTFFEDCSKCITDGFTGLTDVKNASKTLKDICQSFPYNKLNGNALSIWSKKHMQMGKN